MDPLITKSFLVRLVFAIVSSSLVASCSTPARLPDPETSEVALRTNNAYIVTTDDAPYLQVSGSEFDVTTNNCGSRVSSFESFSRSREFRVTYSLEFSDTIRGQLGGDLLVASAELEAAVGLRLGVQLGSTESVRTERQIETPADSITTVRLRWEEIWQAGRAIVVRPGGAEIGPIPFRVLTTLRLSQVGVQDVPCGTIGGQELGAMAAVPAHQPSSTPTSTTIPGGPIAQPTPTRIPTALPASTNTAVPQPTNTPMGMVSTSYSVDAYRTALGSSANTGVYIQAGDSVSITYLYGQWWIGQGSSCNGFGSAQTPTDAAGYLDREGERVEALIGCPNANKCRPMTSAPWGSLLAQIGDGGLIPVGDHFNFVAQNSGILYLRINYYNHNAVTGCPYGDGGTITVRIVVSPP
jgi:hypothetical protein